MSTFDRRRPATSNGGRERKHRKRRRKKKDTEGAGRKARECAGIYERGGVAGEGGEGKGRGACMCVCVVGTLRLCEPCKTVTVVVVEDVHVIRSRQRGPAAENESNRTERRGASVFLCVCACGCPPCSHT